MDLIGYVCAGAIGLALGVIFSTKIAEDEQRRAHDKGWRKGYDQGHAHGRVYAQRQGAERKAQAWAEAARAADAVVAGAQRESAGNPLRPLAYADADARVANEAGSCETHEPCPTLGSPAAGRKPASAPARLAPAKPRARKKKAPP